MCTTILIRNLGERFRLKKHGGYNWCPFLSTSGVESYDIDLKEQKVTVKGNVQPESVLQTVSKTGKKTTFWEAEASEGKPAEAQA